MTPQFREDLRNWIKDDCDIASKVLELVELVMRDPFKGRGKPEKLKYEKNVWSRRITEEHRLVYKVTDGRIDFLQARYHN
nr:Txe/YoeB family addiction module toxin [Planktothrix serta]